MSDKNVPADQRARNKLIVRTNLVAVGVNILLAGTKAVGLMSSSIAVVPGAVNNLSDALYEEVQSPVPDYAIPIAPGPDLID